MISDKKATHGREEVRARHAKVTPGQAAEAAAVNHIDRIREVPVNLKVIKDLQEVIKNQNRAVEKVTSDRADQVLRIGHITNHHQEAEAAAVVIPDRDLLQDQAELDHREAEAVVQEAAVHQVKVNADNSSWSAL